MVKWVFCLRGYSWNQVNFYPIILHGKWKFGTEIFPLFYLLWLYFYAGKMRYFSEKLYVSSGTRNLITKNMNKLLKTCVCQWLSNLFELLWTEKFATRAFNLVKSGHEGACESLVVCRNLGVHHGRFEFFDIERFYEADQRLQVIRKKLVYLLQDE